jgi:hypothetical protein
MECKDIKGILGQYGNEVTDIKQKVRQMDPIRLVNYLANE